MSRTALSRTSAETADGGFVSGVLFMLKTVVVAYCVSIALLLAFSVIATFNALSDRTISVVANIVTAIGVLICGFMSGRHFSSRGLIFGALCGILYSGLLCLIGNLAAQNIHFGASAVTALIIGVICGAVGGIAGINTKSTRRR